MNLRFLLFIISGTCSFAHAQTMVGGNAAKGMDMNTVPYGNISAFGSAEKTSTGSSYLYQDWKTATIELPQGEIKNVPVKVDFKNNQIEINTDKGVRTIAVSRIKRLVIGYEGVDQVILEPTKNYNGQEQQLNGLVEVLVRNDVSLLKYYFSYSKDGAYNAQLDMGNNETRTYVKTRYFLFRDGSLVEIKGNKKKFINKFRKEIQPEIETYVDQNGLNLKDQEDLIAVCRFLNEKQIKF